MTEGLSITHARPILGDLARRIATTHEPIVLTDHGRAIAALMLLPPGQPVEDGDGPDGLPRTERR